MLCNHAQCLGEVKKINSYKDVNLKTALELQRQGLKITSIALQLNTSYDVMYEFLKKRFFKEGQVNTNYAIKMYSDGCSITDIAEYFGTYTSKIRNVLKKNNVPLGRERIDHDKYKQFTSYTPYCDIVKEKEWVKCAGRSKVYVDANFFIKYSHELAYFLGWMATDGNVYKKSNCINLTLVDKEHLKNIFSLFSYGWNERYVPYKNKIDAYGVIAIRNEPLCDAIIRLGINPNKTFNMELPDIPDLYFRDFVRGVFEGDGSFSIRKGGGSIIEITSASSNFLMELGDKICEQTGAKHRFVRAYKDNSVKIVYNVSDYVEIMFHYMYDNVPPNMILKRKYCKMQDYLIRKGVN